MGALKEGNPNGGISEVALRLLYGKNKTTKNGQEIEKYQQQYTDKNGYVKSADRYRIKPLSNTSPLSSSTPELSDADYQRTTGRSRSTLLGG